ARAVHLLVVDRAAVADARARVADAARFGRTTGTATRRGQGLQGLAVERFTDDARERGLAAAARAAEQKRVMHATSRERIRERPRDVLLADDLCKRRRSVFSREYEIGHGRFALYPLGPTLQRDALADLLRLNDYLIAEIS